MANSIRIDGMPQPRQTPGRRPIVLARIPHASADSVQSILSPQVERSADLVVVDERPAPHIPPANHFVDSRQVSSEASPTLGQEKAGERTRSRRRRQSSESRGESSSKSRSVKSFKQTSQSASPPGGLWKIHSQVAPFAGAIVALALVASAGLLYRMIASPSQVPSGFSSTSGSFEASAVELPTFTPKLLSATSEAEATREPEVVANDLPWWETEEIGDNMLGVESGDVIVTAPPEALPAERQLLSIEAPTPEAPATEVVSVPTVGRIVKHTPERTLTKQTVSASVEQVFPSTNRPTALDFSMLSAALPNREQDAPLQQKTVFEVGNRPLSRILTPIKR